MFVNLDVRDFDHPWTHILIPLFRPLVSVSDETKQDHLAASRLSPLACYYADHAQLNQVLFHLVRLNDIGTSWNDTLIT